MISLVTSASAATILARIATPARRSGHSADQKTIMADFAAVLPRLLERFDIVTPMRIAHFLAQLAHESDAFKTTEEYASGAAYEGRSDLGNSQFGDGKRFKGRGLIQVTGRSNYRAFAGWMQDIASDCPDFVAKPEHAAKFPWAAWSAFWYWNTRKLNALAEKDDLVGITLAINGGRNGLSDRAENLARAKTALATLRAGQLTASTGVTALKRGDRGTGVERLQRALGVAGFYVLSIDEQFGPATELAVMKFQRASGLIVDGIAGKATMDALAPYFKGI